MELVDAVGQFVRLAEEQPDAGDGDLAEALMAQGVSEDDAERVVAFVPLALGRLLLPLGGVEVPDRYEIRDFDTGRRARGRISTEPAYVAAMKFAEAHAGEDALVLVGRRSAEVDVVLKLLPEGASIEEAEGIAITEPLFSRIPIPESGSWWRRSRRSG